MTRSRSLAIAGLTAGLLAGGGAGLALTLPSGAGAQPVTTVEVASHGDHTTRMREALQPLVDQGTITAAQLDAVVTALDAARPTESARPGHGGGRPGMKGGPKGAALETVAPLLGTTADEVATALRSGTSIAAQAEAAGVPLQTIVDALVADLADHLKADVEAGRLTQEQADQKLAEAPDRITTMLQSVPPTKGGARGMEGMGGMRRGGGRF